LPACFLDKGYGIGTDIDLDMLRGARSSNSSSSIS
jgi:hypothetical protein